MDRASGKFIDAEWTANCARRLRERWPHADLTSLEEAATELSSDAELRAMSPIEAAETWLQRGTPHRV